MVSSLKVISNVSIRYSTYDFLLTFHRNHASVLRHFQDIASYLSKVAKSSYKCVFAASVGYFPLEFHIKTSGN